MRVSQYDPSSESDLKWYSLKMGMEFFPIADTPSELSCTYFTSSSKLGGLIILSGEVNFGFFFPVSIS